MPKPQIRADHVGSLLRPADLWAEMRRVYEPGHTALLAEERAKDLDRLHELQDRAVADAVARQLAIGLDAISDGELRRYMFTGSFYDSVGGIGPDPGGVTFYDDEGNSYQYDSVPRIVGRLHQIDSPLVRETRSLRSLTDRLVKVTIPAASFFVLPFVFHNGQTELVYATREELLADVIAILRAQVAEAIAAGAGYIQFDFPLYPMLVDQQYTDIFNGMGLSTAQLLDECIAADQRVVEGIIPDDVVVGMHMCRGNWKSRWFARGSLEPIAERMFNELPYDTFLVEWEDTEREGGFEPIRFVPKGKTVAMGIVSTKWREVEEVDDLVRTMEAASAHLDLAQLAICPQCGFASAGEGNDDLDEDIQWRKLERMVEAARRIWPAG
jgi:5-methyltetrahydropteroyltriglutamate--homocysteine methyltransferase